MKILWITIESILPANSGGRIGIFKRLEQIQKSNDIYLFYTMDSLDDEKYQPELLNYCLEAHGYLRKKMSVSTIFHLLRAPYTVASRFNSKMVSDIYKCIVENKIDIINVDSPHMGLNLMCLDSNLPIVLNQHNVEWKVYENVANASHSKTKSLVYRIESNRFKKFEERLYDKIPISLMTFVSIEDLAYFQRKYPNTRNELVPVGANYQNLIYDWYGDQNRIIFVGKMSYTPNIEGAIWFAKNVFPEIKKRINDAKFTIVGKEPTREVLDLEKIDGVNVTGAVKSVTEYYMNSDLVVIPLLHGGGVKIKLLEGLGYNVPIVTTHVGVQGTIFDEEYLLISDTANSMAEQCIEFLKHRFNYKSKYEKAFKQFRDNYTWEKIGDKYNKLLHSVIKAELNED